ncbi:MAG: OprO/OprP family phosphate-selective porin [Planctomycetota bacterium]
MNLFLRTSFGLVLALAMFGTTASAETGADTSLESEVDQYLAQNSGKWGEPNTMRAFWKEGVRFESGDGNFTGHIRGRMLFDMDWRDNDSSFSGEDGLGDNHTGFNAVRLGMEGKFYKNAEYKLEVSFESGEVKLKDVYLGLHRLPASGTLLFGHQKQSFSVGEMTSSRYITFVNRAAVVKALAPARNSGIQWFSSLKDRRVLVAAGMFNDTGDQGTASGNGGWGFNFRIAGLAIENKDKDMILEIGFNLLWQNLRKNGNEVRYRARPGTSIGPRSISTDQIANADDNLRWGFEIAFRMKAFHFSAEYIQASVSRSGGDSDPTFMGWYVQVGWFITGESRSFSGKTMAWGRTKPNANFWTGDGGKGALEVAFRYDTLDLSDAGVVGGEQDAFSVGFNWYWNPNVRMMFNYIHADITDGTEGTGKLNSVVLRWQFDF